MFIVDFLVYPWLRDFSEKKTYGKTKEQENQIMKTLSDMLTQTD